jgi:hypothetical protein
MSSTCSFIGARSVFIFPLYLVKFVIICCCTLRFMIKMIVYGDVIGFISEMRRG